MKLLQMKLVLAAILAISIAIPAGMLLASSSFTTQVTEPIKEERAKAAIQNPIPKVEPPKKEIAIPPPEPNKVVQRPKQDIVTEPEPAKVAEPPRQPAQVSLPVLQAEREILRRGIPENYIFKGALISIWRAQGDRGKDLVRANLTDIQLSVHTKFRDALQEADRKLSGYEGMCNRYDPDGIGPCRYGLPPLYLDIISEEELANLRQILSPTLPIDTPKRQGNIERAYDLVITYGAGRYIIRVNTTWGPP